MTTSTLGIERRVKYTEHYLQSIGEVGSELADLRGEIIKVDEYAQDFKIATVQWDAEPGHSPRKQRVNIEHLEAVGDNSNA